jgi:acyl-CoA thioester hydrolase
MTIFEIPLQIRWADLDANFHIRHSVYFDWAAQCRLDFLAEKGLTPAFMQEHRFGPIIFREEAEYRKEIKYGDKISISLQLIKGRRDYSRWTIGHEIKKEDGSFCASVTVDGAWLNVVERKLFTPPEIVKKVFDQMPVGGNAEWLD